MDICMILGILRSGAPGTWNMGLFFSIEMVVSLPGQPAKAIEKEGAERLQAFHDTFGKDGAEELVAV